MVEIITSFAILGTPTINLEPVWNAVTKTDKQPKLLNISNNGTSMISMPDYNKIEVFNRIYQDVKVDLI